MESGEGRECNLGERSEWSLRGWGVSGVWSEGGSGVRSERRGVSGVWGRGEESGERSEWSLGKGVSGVCGRGVSGVWGRE